MKNGSLIFQIVIALAVAGLYVLHFKKNSEPVSHVAPIPATSKAAGAGMVYIDIDTLLEHYDFYKKLKTDFESRQHSTMSDLEKRKSVLEREYNDAQIQARGGNMTEAQMQETEEKLMKKQQDLMEYKNAEEEKMAGENQKVNKEMYAKLTDYLHRMNAGNNYQFIFGYTREGGILLANDSLNITRYVLEGLNAEFKDAKK